MQPEALPRSSFERYQRALARAPAWNSGGPAWSQSRQRSSIGDDLLLDMDLRCRCDAEAAAFRSPRDARELVCAWSVQHTVAGVVLRWGDASQPHALGVAWWNSQAWAIDQCGAFTPVTHEVRLLRLGHVQLAFVSAAMAVGPSAPPPLAAWVRDCMGLGPASNIIQGHLACLISSLNMFRGVEVGECNCDDITFDASSQQACWRICSSKTDFSNLFNMFDSNFDGKISFTEFHNPGKTADVEVLNVL